MKEGIPVVSVIIPTHNRKGDLRRTLEALKIQTYPDDLLEVITVVDGSTDGTLEMLRDYETPFILRVIAQSNLGQGAARNSGAASAKAPLLLFLDDDVEPAPLLIEAHVRAHEQRKGHVIIAPYLPVHMGGSFIHVLIKSWWEKTFRSMLRQGHRFVYSDLLSGNMSIEADLFARLGGFNPCLRVHEDYEFGMRLIKAEVPFAVAADAMGHHHDASGIGRSFKRKQEEGRADVMMARLHPEFSRALPLAQHDVSMSPRIRILRMLAFNFPAAGDALAAIFKRSLDFLEKARLRSRWIQLYEGLQNYWYWRGAAAESGTLQKLKEILDEGVVRITRSAHELELDLSRGLEEAERCIDRERPAAVRLRFGRRPVGIVHPRAGAENLRGAHLRPVLAGSLAVPLLQAMALEGEITKSGTIDRHRLSKAISARSHWFGPIRPGQMWYEQYSQWNELERGGPMCLRGEED